MYLVDMILLVRYIQYIGLTVPSSDYNFFLCLQLTFLTFRLFSEGSEVVAIGVIVCGNEQYVRSSGWGSYI